MKKTVDIKSHLTIPQNRIQQMMRTVCMVVLAFSLFQCAGQEKNVEGPYTYESGSYFGTGKWYMGREIAHVMGFQGMEWLERPEREAEESVSMLLKNMQIGVGDTIADIGAGSGYHTFKIAAKAKNGLVFAVDIQEEMLATMEVKKQVQGILNISLVKGSEQSIHLPERSVDKVLMVDVYHEFSYPYEMMGSIKNALRPGGKVYLIEYRGEDSNVPIKLLHKMTESQAVKEMNAAGFQLLENIGNLPWQHCMVFEVK